ncbi:MAG: hypothetical protein H6732_13020 [Alphaproteobacteria bacterium]|nr:hypothetical protein [Alphaproteobacteria bacterium]
MRLIRLLSVSCLLASCAPRPCTDEECADACAQRAPSAPASSLDPFAARQVKPLLDDLRAGARIDATQAVFCPGEQGCTRRLPAADAELPAGTWHLELPFRIPRLAEPGDFTASYAQQCVGAFQDELGEVAFREPTIEGLVVTPDDRGRGTLVGPPIIAPDPRPRTCAWRVEVSWVAGETQRFEGKFTMPGVRVGVAVEGVGGVPDGPTPEVTPEPATDASVAPEDPAE